MVRRRNLVRKICAIFAIVICLVLQMRQTGHIEENYSRLSEGQIEQIAEGAAADMEKRRNLVKNVCKKYRLGLYEVKGKKSQLFDHPRIAIDHHFIILQEHNLTYCPINKAASSTWRHHVLHLTGISGSIPQGSILDLHQALTSSIKMVTVRHPFVRLVSAFRDKLENVSATPNNPKQLYSRLVWGKIEARTGSRGSGDVTFRQFVRHLIAEPAEDLDEHWRPFYVQCMPCVVNYDVIAHVETLFRDQMYLIRAARLEGKIRPAWQNRAASGAIDPSRYFQQLSKNDVRRLHGKFRLDFELFGYDQLESYLTFAKEKD
ncbi:carbohydrate sulfotransferase 11-like isoform X2 [Cloeon dipterum]|uniref:carbohydrate sulfotransferase 11-like isoform X2 n=1 Tax=Cloeon dipterum TaxID=197152 RepID=UPI0032202056